MPNNFAQNANRHSASFSNYRTEEQDDMFAMVLDFFDYVIIMVIVSAFGAGAAAVFGADDKARLARLESKVDLLLERDGLELDADAVLPEDSRKVLYDDEN